MKISKFRNRYLSIDEARTSTFRPSILAVTDQQRLALKNLEFQRNSLWYYIGRVCLNIREMRKYRQDSFIKSTLHKIFSTTYHLNEVAEVFRLPVLGINEEVLLTRCTQQMINQQTNQLRPQNQLIHFLKWFMHFDELLLLEVQKIHEQYLGGIRNNIEEQLAINVLKQQQLKH